MTNHVRIACLGAGRMGRGIAVAFAYAGHAVTMIDVKDRTAAAFAALKAEALGEVEKTFARLVDRDRHRSTGGAGVGGAGQRKRSGAGRCRNGL